MARKVRFELLPEDSVKSPLPKLRDLGPLGLGSGQVESLTSYITRLAESHWMASTRFVASVLIDYIPKDLGFDMKQTSSTYYMSNGYGVYAKRLASAISHSNIGVHGEYLTFLPWGKAFDSKGHGLVENHLCWCKSCWREDVSQGNSPYVRLAWQSSQVKVCTKHNERLEEFCPHCGKGQMVLPSIPRAWICQKCGHDLYVGRGGRRLKPANNELLYWTADAVEKLVTRTCGMMEEIPENRIEEVLRLICEKEFQGDSLRMSKALKVNHQNLKNIMLGNRLPTLYVFMDLAYRLGVPPDQLLIDYEQPIVDLREYRLKEQRYFVKMSKLSHLKIQKIKAELTRILRSRNKNPSSLSEVARNLALGVKVLREHFPKESQKIQDNKKIWHEKNKIKRETDRVGRVLKVAEEIYANGEYPSERRIKKWPGIKANDLRRSEVINALRDYKVQIRGNAIYQQT